MSADSSNPRLVAIDWSVWDRSLANFALASGLTVSVYDESGQRRLGPHVGSRVGARLRESPLWSEDGVGTQFERDLAGRAWIAPTPSLEDSFAGVMRVRALRIEVAGQPRGVVIYGWVFADFGSELACERLRAAISGLRTAELWGEARLDPLVGTARMRVHDELLHTLVDAHCVRIESIERLHEVAQAREAFLASVSHELRTPLSAIALRLEVLLRDPLQDPVRIRSMLTAMRRNVDEESRLIEDLIDAARTLNGQLRLDPAWTPLRQIVLAARDAVEPLAVQQGVELVMEAPDAALTLRVDATRLQQVLWNLLANGISFTPAGGIVRLITRWEGSHVEIEVSDNGAGIEPHVLERMFDSFVSERPRHLASRVGVGLGLGLSIAKQIVESHGGRLTAHSDGLGHGATFVVSLPLDEHAAHADSGAVGRLDS